MAQAGMSSSKARGDVPHECGCARIGEKYRKEKSFRPSSYLSTRIWAAISDAHSPITGMKSIFDNKYTKNETSIVAPTTVPNPSASPRKN